MARRGVDRVLLLGTGSGVGKTHVAVALVRALSRRGGAIGLKPVESGGRSDAACLDAVNAIRVEPHPLVELSRPLSPHLAARLEDRSIELAAIHAWIEEQEQRLVMYGHAVSYVVIETAGAAFSPLNDSARNVDLARALAPCRIVLVAPDTLGVLHALTVTSTALHGAGVPADLVVLSTPARDSSTGTNAGELRRLGIADPVLVLGPGDDDAAALADALTTG